MKAIILTSTFGLKVDFNGVDLKQLESEAIQAYNECVELEAVTKGKSFKRAWQIENGLIKAGKLKFGTIFQVTKKELCISYKKNLINGVFKGHNFQMQFLEAFKDIPAGSIFKW